MGKRGMNGFAKYCKIGNSALKAIEGAEGDPQLSTLLKIASKLGLEPWHLFIPDIDPAHKPHLLTQKEIDWHLKVEALVEERSKIPARPSR